MTVRYLHCPHCGAEVFEPITVKCGSHVDNDMFVICPDCGQETNNFDDVDSIVEESTDEESGEEAQNEHA